MERESKLELRLLNHSDLAAAMRLTELANWNQTERDWRRLLRLSPNGCFAACLDGLFVGTVTSITFGSNQAWIGMVLVDPDYRRRGIGKLMMRAALDYLQRGGVTTMKLDATVSGRPLYESLGFVPESVIERWQGLAHVVSAADLPTIDEPRRPAVFALDRFAVGVDRSDLLASLMNDSCVAPLLAPGPADGRLQGYALARQGRQACYVGPVIATDAQRTAALLDAMLNQLAGEKVYIDFPTSSGVRSKLLTDRGFVKQRELIRMRYGREIHSGTPSMVFAIASPEVG